MEQHRLRSQANVRVTAGAAGLSVRNSDIALVRTVLAGSDWGSLEAAPVTFDLDGLRSAYNERCVFSFDKLVSPTGEALRLSEHVEDNNVQRGRGEFLVKSFPGARYSKKGDVFVPGIGDIEIKSSCKSNSYAKLGSSRNGGGRVGYADMINACQTICGASVTSFSYQNLEWFFWNVKDTDAAGTAIAYVMNGMFPFCDRVSDLLLRKGFVRRLRDVAGTTAFRDSVCDEILLPLLEFSFDYYRAVDEFKCVLLMNGTKGLFIQTGDELIDHVVAGRVLMSPSGLNFNSGRQSGIGIRLK